MNKEELDVILNRVKNGEGLNAIIVSLGLNLSTTLIHLKQNHRQEYKDAKEQQKNQSVNGALHGV